MSTFRVADKPFGRIEMLTDPYLPEGWIPMQDEIGALALDTKSGNFVRYPKIEYRITS